MGEGGRKLWRIAERRHAGKPAGASGPSGVRETFGMKLERSDGTRKPLKAAADVARKALDGSAEPPAEHGALRRALTLALALLAAVSGCTSRHIYVTSAPPGAEVAVNERIVGTTPVRVGYSHYGWYKIVLRKEKYKTVVRMCKLSAPFYAWDPISLVADALPVRIVDEFHVHAVLEPLEEADPKAIAARAESAAAGRPLSPSGAEIPVPEYRPFAGALRPGHTGGAAGTSEERGEAGREESRREKAATGRSTGDGKAAKPGEGEKRLDLPPDLKEPEGIEEKPPEGTKPGAEPRKDGKASCSAERKGDGREETSRPAGPGDSAPAGKGRDAPPEEIIETLPPR